MKVTFKERILTDEEFDKLTEHEQEVIQQFCWTTRLNFYRSDLILLKQMLKKNMPAQLIAIVKQAQKQKIKNLSEGKESNFNDFKYLYTWSMQMNLRKKGD